MDLAQFAIQNEEIKMTYTNDCCLEISHLLDTRSEVKAKKTSGV